MRSTSLANPQTLNLYAYCANDPINHTDPSGLGFFSFIGKIFGAIGKALHFVAKVLAVVAAVAAVVFLAWGMPAYAGAFAVMSDLLFARAYGPPIVGKLLNAVGGVARRVTVAGTPPINPNGTAGVGPISGFLAGGQIRITQVNWVSLLLKVSVSFNVPRSQRSRQGELKECGTFSVKVTITGPKGGRLLFDLSVVALQPADYSDKGYRQVGQGSYEREGNKLVYRGTFQIGDILSGGATGNPGFKVKLGLPSPGGTGDVIRIGTIDVAKQQIGHFGDFMDVRDTIPGRDDSDPFRRCP